jgi:deoxyribodipyrimidine photo-lyase
VPRAIHWFRNDLRLRDNTALDALAARAREWLPVFVLDPRLIAGERLLIPRSRFLLACLARLARDLEKRGVPLLVRRGVPEKVLPGLLQETVQGSFPSTRMRRPSPASGTTPSGRPSPGAGERS